MVQVFAQRESAEFSPQDAGTKILGQGHEQNPASTFTTFLSVRSTKLHDWFAPGDRPSRELLVSLGTTAEMQTGLGVRVWQHPSLSQQELLSRTGEGVKQQA